MTGDPAEPNPTIRPFKDASYVLLLNTRTDDRQHHASYRDHKPSHATVFKAHNFKRSMVEDAQRRAIRVEGLTILGATTAGQSCDDVCSSRKMRCHADQFSYINTCDLLEQKFECTGCITSYGPDQPAYVTPTAAAEFSPGKCMISQKPQDSTCHANHQATMRLCPCFQ
jgi:hypothetical protein